MSRLSNAAQRTSAAGYSSESFPDPFMDMASMTMPKDIREALYWCEFLLMANGTYRSALSRVVSYFLTDIEIIAAGSGDDENRISRAEKQKYLDFMNNTLGITNILRTVAMDLLIYGNSFTSLLVPFRRYLSCPQCGFEMPLKRLANTPTMGFSWSQYKFHANCPQCEYSGGWEHIDRRSGETDKIKVKRWSPHEIDILHDPYTDDCAYIWRIPEEDKNAIRKGVLFSLERANWEVIQAVKNNQALLFDPGVIHHMKEEALAGIRSRGWGISRVLVNYRQAYYVQVLHRYNEAIALDYVIPFRVLSPQARTGATGEISDPITNTNMNSFVRWTNKMLRERRRNPAGFQISPYALEYQVLGGDATQLAPHELLEFGQQTLLNSIDIPAEMYMGSLTLQTAPAAMKLFEANWSHLVHNLNRFLNKLVERISQIMSWEPVNCRLQKASHADDITRQMAKMQLMIGGQISRTTGLASMNLDFAEEERRKLEEERIVAEATQRMQEEMEQAAVMDEMAAPAPPPDQAPGAAGGVPMGGAPGAATAVAGAAPPAGGQPPGPGGAMPMGPAGVPMGPYGAVQSFMAGQPILQNQPTTLDEIMSIATTLAQQAMTMPESQKDSFLIQLRRENETVHAVVKSQLEKMRRDAKNRGGELIMQQEYGKAI